jgi:hypothetical protein
MEQPIPYEDQKDNVKLIICKRCLNAIATEFCPKCGCPLCLKCSKQHPCIRDKGQLPN